MHTARKSFIEAESSEKIKRALRHNIRKCNDVRLQSGDHVYYKRIDNSKWHGPGIVIGQHSRQMVVKVGSGTISVHTSRVMRVDHVSYDTPKAVKSKPKVTFAKQADKTDDLPESLLQHYPLFEDDEDDEYDDEEAEYDDCLLYTSPRPRDS